MSPEFEKGRMNVTVENLLMNKINLNCPGHNEIFAAYSALPELGSIELTCALSDLSATLTSLEQAGFIGMQIVPNRELSIGVILTAYKGKKAPCYDTGKFASYTGRALAALDDDNHLLVGKIPVCEKTAVIYSLPAYRKSVRIAGGDPDLIARLQSEPAPFDCDTLEADAAKVAENIVEDILNTDEHTAILYPGPFKLLILHNGATIRRGEPVNLITSIASELIRYENCITLPGQLTNAAGTPSNFKNAYRQKGVLCFFEAHPIDLRFDSMDSVNLTALDETPGEMQQRLLKLIDTHSEYFIITGSDARDLNSCCPSDGVKAANQLVESGVLQVVRPNSSVDACPVNIYAFSGEVKPGANQPVFEINAELRQRVKNHIGQIQKKSGKKMVKFIRWILLAFVLLSLVMVFIKNFSSNNRTMSESANLVLAEEFDVPFADGVLVLLFHRQQRCDFCNSMESHTRVALAEYFSNDRDKIVFRLVNMDLPKYAGLKRKYAVFTSTIVMIKFQNREETTSHIFTAAWQLFDKKDEFIDAFRADLLAFQKSEK